MTKVSCPVCQQAMEVQDLARWPQFPFCSRKCKLIDLGRWLDESYRLPTEEAETGRPLTDEDTP